MISIQNTRNKIAVSNSFTGSTMLRYPPNDMCSSTNPFDKATQKKILWGFAIAIPVICLLKYKSLSRFIKDKIANL